MPNLILVVDMIKGFHNIGNLANPRTAGIVPNLEELLARKSQQGWESVLIRDWHDPADLEFLMFPEHCVARTKETEPIDELARFFIKRNIINKKRYSGFYGTRLDTHLRAKTPAEVIVVGVCTDICVLHTVAGLRNRDYKVIVPEDCVETYDAPPDHKAEKINRFALNHMRDVLGAEVVPTAYVL